MIMAWPAVVEAITWSVTVVVTVRAVIAISVLPVPPRPVVIAVIVVTAIAPVHGLHARDIAGDVPDSVRLAVRRRGLRRRAQQTGREHARSSAKPVFACHWSLSNCS